MFPRGSWPRASIECGADVARRRPPAPPASCRERVSASCRSDTSKWKAGDGSCEEGGGGKACCCPMAKSGEMGFTGGSSIWVADCCGVVGSANPETDRTCQVQEIKFGRGKGFGPRWVEAIGECACMWVCAWQCSQGAVDKPRQADCAPRVVSSKCSAGKRPQSPSAFLAHHSRRVCGGRNRNFRDLAPKSEASKAEQVIPLGDKIMITAAENSTVGRV